jgi:hypothetical protein
VAADPRFRAAVPATARRSIDDATVIFRLFFIFSLFPPGNGHSNKSSVVCVPHIAAATPMFRRSTASGTSGRLASAGPARRDFL